MRLAIFTDSVLEIADELIAIRGDIIEIYAKDEGGADYVAKGNRSNSYFWVEFGDFRFLEPLEPCDNAKYQRAVSDAVRKLDAFEQEHGPTPDMWGEEVADWKWFELKKN